MRGLATLGLTLVVGCADQIPEHIDLASAGAAVEIVYEAPSLHAYSQVGEVTGSGVSVDAEEAAAIAKNDLRNKAGALGATLVTVDQNLGEPMLLVGKTKVTVLGRAYKPLD
jgi:hypothetical protein